MSDTQNFCVHARVLMEFFRRQGVKFTDQTYRPPDLKDHVHSVFWAELNKQVCHLDAAGRYIDASKKIGAATRQQMNN